MPSPLPPSEPGAELSQGWATSADGTRIHWYTAGQGAPAIVCCDGLGCDGYVWKYITEELSPDHRVVRWHYRAHGASEEPRDPARMGLLDLCDDLLAVLDAHGIEKAVLLGHSLGVQVLLEFWRLHPDRVLALVPICGSYGRPVDTFHDNPLLKLAFPYLRRAIHRFPEVANAAWGVIDTELAYLVATHTEVNGQLIKREDFRPYLAHLSQMKAERFFDLLEDARTHDAFDLLPGISVPTLVVAGEKDTFTPARLSLAMNERIPGSELLMVPQGTHTAPIEQPELVNLRLRRFLEERVHPLVAER